MPFKTNIFSLCLFYTMDHILRVKYQEIRPGKVTWKHCFLEWSCNGILKPPILEEVSYVIEHLLLLAQSLLNQITWFTCIWPRWWQPVGSAQVIVLGSACSSLSIFGILCLLGPGTGRGGVAGASLTKRSISQLTACTLLLAGIYCCWIDRSHWGEPWVQVCPRPGFQTRSPGKPAHTGPKKSCSFVYRTKSLCPSKQDTPCMRFSLNIGWVCKTITFYMHLYSNPGSY